MNADLQKRVDVEITRRIADSELTSALTSWVGYVTQALVLLHHPVALPALVIWVMSMVLLEAFHGLLALRARRRFQDRPAMRVCLRLQVLGLLLSGLCWGASAFLPGLAPDTLPYIANLFIMAVVGVLSINVLCLNWPALAAFNCGMLAPTLVKSAMVHSRLSLMTCAVILLAFVFIQAYGYKIRRLVRSEIRGRFATEQLTQDLQAKNEELTAALSVIERTASEDPLTKCLNRRALQQKFGRHGTRRKSDVQRFGVIMIDADHFKAVNDRHGHEAGDQVLVTLVERVNAQLRLTDACARWGGEEFICMIAEVDEAALIATAERIRAGIADQPILLSNATALHMTASIGVSLLLPQEELEAALARADCALYRAKHAGRNRVCA